MAMEGAEAKALGPKSKERVEFWQEFPADAGAQRQSQARLRQAIRNIADPAPASGCGTWVWRSVVSDACTYVAPCLWQG